MANANEHVPEAERNNRTIKEHIRATFHSLPFQAIPTTFIKLLATETAEKLNFFPSVNGISAYYSPREIMSQQQLNYFKSFSVSQFRYVQAHDDPKLKNTQQARTIDCIYIQPIYNQQGGHYLYNLSTHDYITRQYVTDITMTIAVIEEV